MLPVDSPKYTIAIVFCNEGYDEMMKKINDADSLCSDKSMEMHDRIFVKINYFGMKMSKIISQKMC